MGVAFGKFRPTLAYATMLDACVAAFENGQCDDLDLSVEAEDGRCLPVQGGVMILDRHNFSPEEIEVNVAGIPYPLYEELFLQQVAAYHARQI